ncbi:hypothetical protein [Rubrivivax sp. A210]|uniref:hypothetical protein n=1 Tax=Rubrivivax sp. A210 TaxID=2772301 RepID=UPI001918FEB4|nr:hypothetical protein [Rubrivivax sp. A210]
MLAAAPLRGNLQLNNRRPGYYVGQRNAPLLAGLVSPGETRWMLPPLDQARVVVIRGPEMVISGIEAIEQARQLLEFHQAWWCRLLPEAAGGAAVRTRAVAMA